MNSANYSPQEMWNSGCQLGEWGQEHRAGRVLRVGAASRDPWEAPGSDGAV